MKRFIFLIIIVVGLGFGLKYLAHPPKDFGKTEWGLNFSKTFSEEMGLDFRALYLDVLDDLKPQYIRLPIYWNDVQKKENEFNFEDYDFFVAEAKKRNIRLTLALGRKLPRWPECHEPEWIKGLSPEEQNKKLLEYIRISVLRYKDDLALEAWQIENEPFLPFGECPKTNPQFLDEEIALVKSLDNNRPILITDSGELGLWFKAAKRADIFGTTMYRIIWNKYIGHFKYPLPPQFFWIKANLIRLIYGNKPIIVSELQAEPWSQKLIYESDLNEQSKSMNLDQLKNNIEYAKAVGFRKTYLWGTEWWYWMKTKHNEPKFWEEIKNLLAIN